MSGPVSGLVPFIDVDGAPLAEGALNDLVALDIDRSLNLPSRATLSFVDHGFTYSADTRFAVGARVVVKAGSEDSATVTVVFSGRVTGASMQRIAADAPMFRVVVDDDTIVLTQATSLKSYLTQSPSAIIGQIAERHTLLCSVTTVPVTFDYVLQTVTDMYLLDELCRRAGLVWWFDPASRQLRVRTYAEVLAAAPTVTLDADTEIVEYAVSASSLHAGVTDTRGWDEATKEPVTGTASDARSPTTASFVTRYLTPPGTPRTPSGTRTDATAGGLTALARGELDAGVRRSVVAEVTLAVAPAIAPGVTVEVADLGPLNGRYLVTRVEHEFSRRGFVTRFSTGDFGVPDLGGSTAGPAHAFGVPALQSAIVTDLNDPEKRGRVRVKLPSVGDQVDTTWARVAILGGGGTRGIAWLPEVDDEVVVGFQDGDARRAVVLGGLINGRDTVFTPEIVEAGRHDVRRMTSRAGNVIEFGDADGSEHLRFSVPKGPASVEIAHDAITVDGGTKPIRIKDSGGSIELDGKGAITLKGTSITLEATTELVLKGATKVGVAGAQIDVAADATLSLKANAKAEVSASGVLALKGAVVQVN